MPHINRIRVNNVKYNFGTQAYDDFIMKPFCHNTLYDLANGGGKSVLMLLMLQNVLPNCTLDEKQPVEKLFRTGDGSQTIHSLIEWRLDECDEVNGFQYMTTGFCAKKAAQAPQEEDIAKDTASIEYFNYCVFYREYNQNDIRNLPLVKDKERITYQGLKKYLKELERDHSYMVYVFDKKRDYQAFISRYGLYESEWEIIRGINKTEGHVRTYFETNYKTTRKVVEDLLIEEIIQKSFQLKDSEGEDETMSKTLLDIREKLMELSKRKNEIHNYDRQMELLSNFSIRLESYLRLYEQKETCEQELVHTFALANQGEKYSEHQYQNQLEEIKSLKASVITYQKKLEQAKVYQNQRKLSILRESIHKISVEMNEKLEEKLKLENQLRLKECMNEYLLYLEEKKKRNEACETLSALQNKNSDLSNEVSTYVYFMKEHFDQVKSQLSEELKRLSQEGGNRKAILEEKRANQLRILQEVAVSDRLSVLANEKKVVLLSKITNKKSQVGLLLLEELPDSKKENERQQQQLEKVIHTLSNQKNSILTTQKQNHISIVKNELELDQLRNQEMKEQDFLSLYVKEKRKAEQLLVAYGQKDYEKLREEIHARLKRSVQIVAESKKELLKMGEELIRLERGEFSLDGKLLIRAREAFMSLYPLTLKTGLEYLSELSKEEKIEVMSKHPYLPYALVSMEEHSSFTISLQGKEFDNYVVPMVTIKALKELSLAEPINGLQLITKDQSILFDEKRLESEKSRISREIEELKRKITRLEDQENTYTEDEAFIQLFIETLYTRFREVSEQHHETQQAIAERKLRLQELRTAQEDAEASLVEFEDNLNKTKADMKDCIEKSKIFSELDLLSKDYEQECKSEKQHRDRVERFQMDVNDLSKSISEFEKELEDIFQQLTTKQQRITEIENLWESKYKLFYVNGDFIRPKLSLEEMTIKLNGALAAMESKYSDLEDKNRLINSYIQAMNRCLKSIEGKGMSISKLEELRSQDSLFATSDSDLVNLEQQLKNLTIKVQELTNQLAKVKEEGSRLEGSVDQSIAVYEENFGSYVEEKLEEVEYSTFIKEAKEKIAMIGLKEKQLSDGLVTRIKEKEQFSLITKDIKRLLHHLDNSEFLKDHKVLSQINCEELVKRKEQLEKQWFRLEKDLRAKEDEFTQNKLKTREALIALNAVGLADEFQSNVKFTANSEETLQLIRNLGQVNECLQLEKDRITSGLDEMVQIKDNFENQCLQRCIHIKTELERLPKLSRITLDGELIPMISLSIPYVKEEFYKEKMSDYIGDIVKGADAFSESSDRMKYIRNALCLKKLFSVIVTDMNAIKLSLYKRERIKEHSRHLRYEEAVGSTGQSQGIYTQFLISIITYISNINSHRGDNSSLRKVIFIDNPFGAAKDIYIWEPIFELLEENKVQMIVPARGTTPAITSRFDVNYILGQKLVGQRQQTVVVDYHSSVNARETEFIPLKYEQTSFDLFES